MQMIYHVVVERRGGIYSTKSHPKKRASALKSVPCSVKLPLAGLIDVGSGGCKSRNFHLLLICENPIEINGDGKIKFIFINHACLWTVDCLVLQ